MVKVRFRYEAHGPRSEGFDPADFGDVADREALHMAVLEQIEDKVSWAASVNSYDLDVLWEAVQKENE